MKAVSEANNGQCQGTSQLNLSVRVKNQVGSINYRQAQFEVPAAMVKTLEHEVDPGLVMINDPELQRSQNQSTVGPTIVVVRRDGIDQVEPYTEIKDPVEFIQTLLGELKAQQTYAEYLTSGQPPDDDPDPGTSTLEAMFVIPSFDEMSTLDLEGQCGTQVSIINNVLREIDRMWDVIHERESIVNASKDSDLEESFVMSVCEQVLAQLDPDDHVRRGQVEAIELEGDPMKKMDNLVQFLVDDSRPVASQKDDESVSGQLPMFTQVGCVRDSGNKSEVQVGLADRKSVEGQQRLRGLAMGSQRRFARGVDF
jgi:hypothetical protein